MNAADDPEKEITRRGFPAVSFDAWRQRVENESADNLEALSVETLEGLRIAPLYTGVNAGLTASHIELEQRGMWRIATEIEGAATAATLRRDQQSGSQLVWLRLDGAQTAADLEGLARAIEPDTEVHLSSSSDDLAQAALWLAAMRRAGQGPEKFCGCLGLDPLAALGAEGRLRGPLEDHFRQMSDLAGWATSRAPGARAVRVSTQAQHDAGADLADQVAFSLATGTEYLRQLTSAGLDIDSAVAQIDFVMSVGRDLFAEVAKLRAAREAWTRVVKACGGTEGRMRLHVRASSFESSRIAPRTNILRSGLQAFVAAVGGADSISAEPFDAALGAPSSEARELALDSQHILREEAHLRRGDDPGAGSWYLESLTDATAREAWRRFQEIEARGGMAPHILSGDFAQRIHETAEKRRQAIADRSEPLVGCSLFADLNDAPVELRSLDSAPQAPAAEETSKRLEGLASLADGEMMSAVLAAAEAGATLAQLRESMFSANEDLSCPSLRRSRRAEPFEELRAKSDELTGQLGHRPRASVVQLGALGAGQMTPVVLRRLLATAGIEAHLADDLDDDAEVLVLTGENAASRTAKEGRVVLVARGQTAPQPAGETFLGVLSEGEDVVEPLRGVLRALGASS